MCNAVNLVTTGFSLHYKHVSLSLVYVALFCCVCGVRPMSSAVPEFWLKEIRNTCLVCSSGNVDFEQLRALLQIYSEPLLRL